MGWNKENCVNGTLSVKRNGVDLETVTCRYIPQYVSKLEKYRPVANCFQNHLELNCCTVLPLVFGVRGFIPASTMTHFQRMLSPRAELPTAALTRTLVRRCMHVIFQNIIKTYRRLVGKNYLLPPMRTTKPL